MQPPHENSVSLCYMPGPQDFKHLNAKTLALFDLFVDEPQSWSMKPAIDVMSTGSDHYEKEQKKKRNVQAVDMRALVDPLEAAERQRKVTEKHAKRKASIEAGTYNRGASSVPKPGVEFMQYLNGVSSREQQQFEQTGERPASSIVWGNASVKDVVELQDEMMQAISAAQTVEFSSKQHLRKKDVKNPEEFFKTINDFPQDFFTYWGQPQYDEQVGSWGASAYSHTARMAVIPLCYRHFSVPIEIIGIILGSREDFVRKVCCWSPNVMAVAAAREKLVPVNKGYEEGKKLTPLGKLDPKQLTMKDGHVYWALALSGYYFVDLKTRKQ